MRLRKRTKRFLIGGGVLVVVAVLAIMSLSGSDDSQTVVQADLVTRDDISEIVTASGRIQPQTKVDIVAEVSAEIIALYVNEGERVTRGQPLLMLDTVQVLDPAEVECLLAMVANVLARLVQDDAQELTGDLDDVDA